MSATVQNLRKLAKLKYKPPDDWIGAPLDAKTMKLT
jgi:hypothetical protein